MNSNATKTTIFPSSINYHIGMRKVQSGAKDYMISLKKFLEKDELHQLSKTLQKRQKSEALKKIYSLQKKTLNLGLMKQYELYVEMESIVSMNAFSETEELLQEAAANRNAILTEIA